MNVAIRQVRGGSGVDFWAKTLCQGIRNEGLGCELDLCSGIYQFIPPLAKLKKIDSNSDIIHSNSWNAFAFKGDTPLIVTEHHVIDDPIFNPYKTAFQTIFHRWIYHCECKSLKVADSVICVSDYTKKRLENVYGFSDSKVIYNGIDTSVFKRVVPEKFPTKTPDDTFVIFFAGNLSNRKGGDLLPAIMEQLGKKFFLLLATGKDNSRPYTGHHNIRNLGNLTQEQLVSTYNRCDLFISASRLEGFGLSVAEAMACEKPVVATNCSSLPELIVDGKGGLLCQINNVKDYAKKIRYLAEDDELRQKMGSFNRKRVIEKFEISRMVKEYIKVYELN